MKSPKLQLTAPNRFIGWAAVDEAMGQAAAGTALGRMVTEDDVARAALFLACDLSSGITGALVPVDGGLR